MNKWGIMVCGHGSRDERAVEEFQAVARGLRERMPEHETEWGFLEFATPIIRDGLDALRTKGFRKVLAVPAERAGARRAELSYRLLDPVGRYQCLEVQLQTGRKHQIRVQLSARGLPIVGDRKYDSLQSFPVGIALHSCQLEFSHPVGDEWLQFQVPPPASWPLPRA